ncbi:MULTISPECIES: hypothetical protein [Gordonia]|uniref:Minor tail protein n=1 Tax=Gordonia sihwensis NBRC 108236 TaxID=1223544 RepID=L7LM42_9ACTN|nr:MULTISPECIES: hypothetical protein [Gordonia]AUH68535.1 hypothetical protein CXX93_09425 [Gordonia sp. YC-JH1]GAC62205.1 hypothetical protein GSI01S_30_00130 [Gordonia sihwensis NBRC 108236]
MSISLGGRSIRGLRYVDEVGEEHVIILAYLDGVAVWDGRIPQLIQVPRARASAVAFVPEVAAEALLVAPIAVAYAEAAVPTVAGAVGISPPTATASAVAHVPGLTNGHVLDIPTAIASAEAHVPVVAVVAGIIAPTAVATAVAHVPEVSAAVDAAVPQARAYAEAHVPEVGSRVEVLVPLAEATALAHLPDVQAAVAVAAPMATATAVGSKPTVSAGAEVAVPQAMASAVAHVPEVKVSTGPDLVGTTTSSSTTVPLPAHQSGDLILVFASNLSSNTATAPTLPSGWTSAVVASSGARAGWKIAASGSETSGTWTNATRMIAMVWRGAQIGATATDTSGNVGLTSVNWPALGTKPDSWTIRYLHARSNGGEAISADPSTEPDALISSIGNGVKLWGEKTPDPVEAGTASLSFSQYWRNLTVEIQPEGAQYPLDPIASATNGTSASSTVTITLPEAATVFAAVAGVGGGPPEASTMTSGGITGTQVYTHAGNNIRLTVARFDLPEGTHTITSDSDRAIVAAAYRGTATLGTPVWTNGATSASVAADMKVAVFTTGGQVSSTTSGTLRATAYKGGGWSCSVSIVEGAQSSISGAEGSVVLPLT